MSIFSITRKIEITNAGFEKILNSKLSLLLENMLQNSKHSNEVSSNKLISQYLSKETETEKENN